VLREHSDTEGEDTDTDVEESAEERARGREEVETLFATLQAQAAADSASEAAGGGYRTSGDGEESLAELLGPFCVVTPRRDVLDHQLTYLRLLIRYELGVAAEVAELLCVVTGQPHLAKTPRLMSCALLEQSSEGGGGPLWSRVTSAPAEAAGAAPSGAAEAAAGGAAGAAPSPAAEAAAGGAAAAPDAAPSGAAAAAAAAADAPAEAANGDDAPAAAGAPAPDGAEAMEAGCEKDLVELCEQAIAGSDERLRETVMGAARPALGSRLTVALTCAALLHGGEQMFRGRLPRFMMDGGLVKGARALHDDTWLLLPRLPEETGRTTHVLTLGFRLNNSMLCAEGGGADYPERRLYLQFARLLVS
jgi:hypothetical protein